jgi:asparagine synthase (glutamine-hydrolysing)
MAHQVYWVVVNGRFYFATHLKSLLMCPEIPRETDRNGLNLFLKYSYIPSPATIFQGIKKLPPGHLLVFKDGEATHNCYWEFRKDGHPVGHLEDEIHVYKGLLRDSVSRRLGQNHDTGILLSGGLDSSANVALAAQCTDKKLKTFAVGFQDSTFDERPYAKIVAEHFGTEHHEYTISGKEIESLPNLIWHLEEPYFEFGLFLTYLGMAAAKKEVDVILGGEGADQMFGTGGFAGGLPTALRFLLLKSHLLEPASRFTKLLRGSYFYERDNWAFKFRLLWNRVVDLNHWYFYGYDENELAGLYGDKTLGYVAKIFPDGSNGHPASFESLYHKTHVEQDIKHYANENVMVKSGRMADMLDLTLREPYFDIDVADFLVSLDFQFKRSGHLLDHLMGNVQTKFLHRKAMEGLLPHEVMTKPKQGGFVPVMIFLGDPDLRKRIYGHLLRSEAIRAHFNLDYVNALFDKYERIQGNKIYWHNFYNSKANRILFLLTYDVWHHFYMESSPFDVVPQPLSEYLLSL